MDDLVIKMDDVAALKSIPTLLQVEDNEYEHIELYGPPKSGKTLAALALSEFYNILLFNGDKGLKTAINIFPKEMQERIHVISTPDNTSKPMYWNTMLNVVSGRKLKLCLAHGYKDCIICRQNKMQEVEIALNTLPANWIAIEDSMTQFVSSAISAISAKAFGMKDGDTKDDVKFTFDEWGNLRQITEKHGNYIKDLLCKWISITHEMMVEQEDKTKRLMGVGGSEAGSAQYARYFSSCIYSKVNNGKHTYYSSSNYSPNIQTGTRSGVSLEKEEIPSLLHIFEPTKAKELLKGSWNEWFYKGKVGPEPKPKSILEI